MRFLRRLSLSGAYIGRRSQGNVEAARIRTSRVCSAYDRIHNVPGCPKI